MVYEFDSYTNWVRSMGLYTGMGSSKFCRALLRYRCSPGLIQQCQHEGLCVLSHVSGTYHCHVMTFVKFIYVEMTRKCGDGIVLERGISSIIKDRSQICIYGYMYGLNPIYT